MTLRARDWLAWSVVVVLIGSIPAIVRTVVEWITTV